jgi:hypothetical protein
MLASHVNEGFVEGLFGLALGIAMAATVSENTVKTLLKRILIDVEENLQRSKLKRGAWLEVAEQKCL